MDTEEEKGVASETDVTVSEYQKTSLSDLIGNWVNKDLDLYLSLIFIGMENAIQELQAVFINQKFYKSKIV